MAPAGALAVAGLFPPDWVPLEALPGAGTLDVIGALPEVAADWFVLVD